MSPIKRKNFDIIKFEDILWSYDERLNGDRARISFSNGYSANIIKSEYSMGGMDGLYELAVMYLDKIVDDTPITDDVIGYLTPRDIEGYLKEIKNLPERKIKKKKDV